MLCSRSYGAISRLRSAQAASLTLGHDSGLPAATRRSLIPMLQISGLMPAPAAQSKCQCWRQCTQISRQPARASLSVGSQNQTPSSLPSTARAQQKAALRTHITTLRAASPEAIFVGSTVTAIGSYAMLLGGTGSGLASTPLAGLSGLCITAASGPAGKRGHDSCRAGRLGC